MMNTERANLTLLEAQAKLVAPRRVIETVTCPVCSFSYVRGLAADMAEHRRYHRKTLSVLEPKPHSLLKPNALLEVGSFATAWKNRLMYDRAVQFKREFGYGFIQWEYDYEHDGRVRGFVFVDDQQAPVGACALRWRRYEDAPHAYAMQWIWLCPRARRTGILSSHWPALRERFGAFECEPPLSGAMQAFLAKHEPQPVGIATP
jgi:hypothetical protein